MRNFLLPILLVALIPPQTGSGQVSHQALDLPTISRIRDEGLTRSHVMSYASELFDGIGARLTASPEYRRSEAWAIRQLQAIGVENPHTESFGPFGASWTQLGTSVLLAAPSSATVLAQATPWSPATPGQISADVVYVPLLHSENEFSAWKGKLAGKIVLYGDVPSIRPNPRPPLETTDETELKSIARFPLDGHGRADEDELVRGVVTDLDFQELVGRFFASEGVSAALRTNMNTSIIEDDTSVAFGTLVYLKSHRQKVPSAVISADSFGRMARLLKRGVGVRVMVNIQTKFDADEASGENVVGEIPGSDPTIGKQVVLLGGHLDSWIAGTGATDNGAGVVVALEAMRILRALKLKPRRTIRIALWGGEEQGLLGSLGYIRTHLADVRFSNDSKWASTPEFSRPVDSVGPKQQYDDLDVYFNTDNGTGRFLGVYAEDNLQAADLFRHWKGPLQDLGFDTVTLQGTGGTDHTNFDKIGLPGFQFIQDMRDYRTRTHHTNLDTYERLSEPDLKQAATILAILAWDASQQNERFPRKPFESERK